MNENTNKPKLSDESTLKCKLALSQSRIQQSFKQPFKLTSTILTVFTYIQCLKYPIDTYSSTWFRDGSQAFIYFDISYYTQQITSIVCSSISLIYCLFSLILICCGNRIRNQLVLRIAKLCQMSFSTVLFMAIIGDNCQAISSYFKSDSQKVIEFVLALFSLITFTLVIGLQTLTRFDFIMNNNKMSSVIRSSNWSSVTLLAYIVINELTIKFADLTTPTHLIIMTVSIALHGFILVLKCEHEEQTPFRMELSMVAISLLSAIILMCITLLKLKLDFGMVVILSVMSVISISKVQYFNIVFQLQNVNKWTTSQIMISYAAKLRKILVNYDDYYFNVNFLGYVEIHQQKCDNQACPLRNIGPSDQTKKIRFEDIIKKIYNDGCKLSPVNPELLLEYAIFYYETGAHDKSMKTLLDVKENELTLDKFFKYVRLKNIIYRETSEIPSKDFLDLLSQIKVKDIQQKIIKKFEESALISLEFWSILNEDHPNFRKLYEIGKSKVVIGQEVHELYRQINKIAHSERITSLYIHYLNQIENEEKMYSEVEGSMKNEEGFDSKIVIEDWANNCNPIIIVSIEEENFGSIIDLNTTCATVLGHEKFDMVGRDIKTIFPGVLATQINRFLSNANREPVARNEQYFYVGYNSGFCLRIKRKLQHYNSIETGLSLIVTIQNRFIPDSGFMLFNSENQLVTISSSCLQLLDLEDNILENQNYFSDLFEIPVANVGQEKTTLLLQKLLKEERVKRYADEYLDSRHLQRLLSIDKKSYGQFYVINIVLVKSLKIPLPEQAKGSQRKINNIDSTFQFSVGFEESQFFFLGSASNQFKSSFIELTLSKAEEQKKQVNESKKDYSEHITTLRLHENYIKVIQESSSQNSEGEKQSQTSTNNELIAKVKHIPKADEERIFESRESYHTFVDKFIKKIYLKTGLAISIIICVGIYIWIFFAIKDNYTAIRTMYYRFALGNRVIGEIAESNRIILQTKYYSAVPNLDTEWLLMQNYDSNLQRLQAIIKNYTLPYPLEVYIDDKTTHQFRSDQFILAFISQFSKVRTDVVKAGGFKNLTLNSNSSQFVQINGNLTKQRMNPHANAFKQKCKDKSTYALNFLVVVSGCGIVLALILTFFILFSLRKLNLYKVEILSVFLQTTEKDIQNFSQKTENFLVTLHVDESNENNEPVEDLFENKKNSPVMFAKKKRFKSTQFQKVPYFILASFFFVASAYFIHLLSFTIQKNIFIVDAIEYFDVVSAYGDVLATSQAKIYNQLNDNFKFYGSNTSITNSKLSGEINTKILGYERQFFTWHYKTYGSIDSYHQKFATVFMRDICKGEIKIRYACNAGAMAENGTLLMLTDITIENKQIDYTKPLNPVHYITVQAIKEAHLYLLNEVMNVSDSFFNEINSNILQIMLIWALGLIFFGLMLELYIQRVVVRDANLVKSMLKFFPISFASHSEGVNSFIATIIEQQGSL